MKLTLIDLKTFFLDVINKKKSFEEAGIWASKLIEKDEIGELEIPKEEDVSRVFSAITYLLGLPTEESPGIYLHSIENVKNKFDDLFGNQD